MTDPYMDLWETIGKSDPLTPELAQALTDMLTAMVMSGEKSSSLLFNDTVEEGSQATFATTVISIFFMERRNAIVAYLYQAPTTVIYAQFKDWVAEGVNEDGTLNKDAGDLSMFTPIMVDAPSFLSDHEQAEAFAAKAEEIQDDEAAAAFDALLEAYPHGQ